MTRPTKYIPVVAWYERPMRIGALQCNLEGGQKQTMAVMDKWLKQGVNVEQLFHPCADSYAALFDERRHGRILRRYLAAAHRKGLRITDRICKARALMLGKPLAARKIPGGFNLYLPELREYEVIVVN